MRAPICHDCAAPLSVLGLCPWCEGTACEVCEEANAEWTTAIGGGGILAACGGCVDCHASDRMEPGVTWHRLDGKARQTDGLVMIGGAA